VLGNLPSQSNTIQLKHFISAITAVIGQRAERQLIVFAFAMTMAGSIRTFARCKNCNYKLYNWPPLATETFAIRHGIRKKHLVEVVNIDTENVTSHDFRAKIETRETPF